MRKCGYIDPARVFQFAGLVAWGQLRVYTVYHFHLLTKHTGTREHSFFYTTVGLDLRWLSQLQNDGTVFYYSVFKC